MDDAKISDALNSFSLKNKSKELAVQYNIISMQLYFRVVASLVFFGGFAWVDRLVLADSGASAFLDFLLPFFQTCGIGCAVLAVYSFYKLLRCINASAQLRES